MTDIVERLRDPEQGLTSSDRYHLHKDAAAEIERLQAALRKIAWDIDGVEPDLGQCMTIAADAINSSSTEKK